MARTHIRKRIMGAALLSGGVALAGSGPVAGAAHALPAPPPLACDPICHGTWCPGQRLPVSTTPIDWDMGVCHDYHQVHGGGIVEGPLPPDAVRCPPIAFLCP